MAAPDCSPGNGGATARYCLVSGIPTALRSAQLRAYFSQFVEAGGFLCFHYRHRPERPPAGSEEAAAPRSCSCLVAVKPGRARRFVRMYSGKRWVGPGGVSLPGRCFIRRVRLGPGTGTEAFSCKEDKTAAGESLAESDLKRLPEFNPPSFMPNGNVGTPLRVFLELIRACRLPPRIIKKLQLDFPKTGSSRRYGNVPFEYQDTETVVEEERVYTATGDEITEEEGPVTSSEVTHPASAEEDEEGQKKKEEPHSDDDNDTCEEWERHEALHEDVTKQDRVEERLFEEEIELKWEKGGSGLVFYTDAQYWQEKNGDFDEQTADDWDVDMSIYYDKDGGDKDARDSVQMWLEQRLRDGLEDGSVSGQQIGTFERYTKGFGRKVLEQQGWMEGLGLGSSNSGMAEALDNEGQNPRCKRGLGYHGEKLPTYTRVKKPRWDAPILISTIYDDPDPKDSGDQLLRRQPPTAMKYRQDMAFVRASHGAFRSQS
ncbi:GPTC3 protein, partial [Heliornis fulica]|nr:GPTC3 protein [Heliornis fulica]